MHFKQQNNLQYRIRTVCTAVYETYIWKNQHSLLCHLGLLGVNTAKNNNSSIHLPKDSHIPLEKVYGVCGNKMPTRCNRGFYCRSYCLLNMFRAPLCPSSGCCCILQTGHITLSSALDQQLENHSTKYHRQQPLYDTLELLMMGIVVPETR